MKVRLKSLLCVMIFSLSILLTTLRVNADEVLKYRDYVVNDVSGFLMLKG